MQDMYKISGKPASDFIADMREGLYTQRCEVKTGGGYLVTIRTDEGGGDWPIKGRMSLGDRSVVASWTKEGYSFDAEQSQSLSDYDLVLVPIAIPANVID